MLRDIIDLDATYAGPDAKSLPGSEISPDSQTIVPGQLPTPNTASVATPYKPADKRTDSDETAAESAINESDLDDDGIAPTAMELVLLGRLFGECRNLFFGLSLFLRKGHPFANDFSTRLVVFPVSF